jgi:outer membrane protein OmpA-like peptidoglycan-associated protein
MHRTTHRTECRPKAHPHRGAVGRLALAAAVLAAAGCSEAEDLIDEQTGGTLPDITIPEDIDLNAPDFDVPEIVAPDIDIDIDITEAPELPVIRFPDAVTIELPEITSDEVEITETDEETIYTVEGQVLFDFDRADLRPEALDILAEVLDAIENRGYGGTIEIAGHTDSIGEAEYNQDLSVRRATGVALWFRERVPEDQDIQAIGYGETQPIARNTLDDGSDDPVGRAQNRRVEIIVNKS